MTEQAQPPQDAKRTSPLMGWAWLIAGILGIALLLAMSLFIGGLGEFR